MPQIHYQQTGLFHVITKTLNNIPWCTKSGVPECLLSCLFTARDLYGTQLYAFCILPNHLHLLLCPGSKGLSKFMQAFKSNSTKALRTKCGIEKFRWHPGFYDERIRDERQRSAVIAYVQGNAMRHGLVSDILDWPWTSLKHQAKVDPLELW